MTRPPHRLLVRGIRIPCRVDSFGDLVTGRLWKVLEARVMAHGSHPVRIVRSDDPSWVVGDGALVCRDRAAVPKGAIGWMLADGAESKGGAA